MPLSDDDVREILRIVDESELDELLIETEGFSLHVRKGGDMAAAGVAPAGAAAPRAARTDASPPAAPARDAPAGSAPVENGLVEIPSPMLGTFYRAESPGAAPFVEVGTEVMPDTTVGIIEVMKMMNSVSAGVAGTVAEICADNAALVEYGQPLFRVTPAS